MNIKIEYLKPGMSYRLFDKPLSENDIMKLKKEKIKRVDIEVVDKRGHLLEIVVDYLVTMLNEAPLDERITCIDNFISALEINDIYPNFNVYLEEYEPVRNYIYTSVILSNLIKNYNRIENSTVNFHDTIFAYFFKELGREAKDPRVLEKIRTFSTRTFYNLHEDFPIIDEELLNHYNPDFYFIYSYLLLKKREISDSILDTVLFSFEKEESSLGPLNTALVFLEDENLANRVRVIRASELYSLFLYVAKDETDVPFANVERNLEKAISQNILNPFIVNIMTSAMPIYNIGDRVRLSDNTIGIVDKINRKDLIHPIVYDLLGNRIDLRREIYIKNIEYED